MPRKKPLHIHFICTGNAYRSRLAEAYLRSLIIPGVTVSSSGIEADKYRRKNGPICWYALRLAVKYGINEHISEISIQTTDKHLKSADHIVFMHPENHQLFLKIHRKKPASFETWDIPDLDHLGFISGSLNNGREQDLIQATEETFTQIKMLVEDLVKRQMKN